MMTPYEFCRKHGAEEDLLYWSKNLSDWAAVWSNIYRPCWMLWFLRAANYNNLSILRLFSCWCCRSTPVDNEHTVWPFFTEAHSRNAVDVAERFACSNASSEELISAHEAAKNVTVLCKEALKRNEDDWNTIRLTENDLTLKIAAWTKVIIARRTWKTAMAAFFTSAPIFNRNPQNRHLSLYKMKEEEKYNNSYLSEISMKATNYAAEASYPIYLHPVFVKALPPDWRTGSLPDWAKFLPKNWQYPLSDEESDAAMGVETMAEIAQANRLREMISVGQFSGYIESEAK